MSAATSRAAWLPAGVDLTRPRLLLRAADVPAIQARVAREPWRSVVEAMLQRSALADGLSMDDHAIDSEMMKARSARNLAFLHAIDRTLAGGEVVPFPSPQARQAAGDRVRDLLLSMFDRSRLALDPPLGGWTSGAKKTISSRQSSATCHVPNSTPSARKSRKRRYKFVSNYSQLYSGR